MNDNYLKMPMVLRKIKERYQNGYSPVIEVCGKMRVSKTSKVYLWAKWLSADMFKKDWEEEKGSIISVDDMTLKMHDVNFDCNIFVMDEVQRQLSRKRWQNPKSQLFNLLIESQAYKHYIIFLILPHAWELGSDHAYNVNYVIPIHNRTLCYPYKLEVNDWDISAQRKEPRKFNLGHFKFNYMAKTKRGYLIRKQFKEELGGLFYYEDKDGRWHKDYLKIQNFRRFIEINLKENIMQEAVDGLKPKMCMKCGSMHKKGECPLKQ